MTFSDAGTLLYPPRAEPSRGALRFPLNLVKTLSNNLELIPEQAYHEPYALLPGPPRMAFLTGEEFVKAMLLSRHQEFPKARIQNEILEPVFGDALASKEGAEWKWQRGAAAPLFRHETLMGYGPIMTAAAEATVQAWWEAGSGSVRLINTDMMHAAFQVISRTMLAGGAPSMIEDIERGHGDYYAGMNWWVVYKLLGLPHWLPRPGGRRMRAHERRLRDAVRDLMEKRSGAAAGGDDLLARMVGAIDPETGRAMPGNIVLDNLVSFLMSGYDTTALALTWSLYLVSRSPEWEQRMLAEVEQVAGDAPVTTTHYRELTVVQQVLNEALRLYPTAPIIVRDFTNDMEVEGVTFRKGTLGVIPIYAIHRHRNYWADPDAFDPSRFDPARGEKISRFRFLPFGAGPRICIGASFSFIEATIMLATFVRAARFETEPSFDPRPTGRMFLQPANGMPMRVTLRAAA